MPTESRWWSFWAKTERISWCASMGESVELCWILESLKIQRKNLWCEEVCLWLTRCRETPPGAREEFWGAGHSAVLWATEVLKKAPLQRVSCTAGGCWQLMEEVSLAMEAPFVWAEWPASAFEVYKLFLLLLESCLDSHCWGVSWALHNIQEALCPGCAEAGLTRQTPPLVTEIQTFYLSWVWIGFQVHEREGGFFSCSEPSPGHHASEEAGLGV